MGKNQKNKYIIILLALVFISLAIGVWGYQEQSYAEVFDIKYKLKTITFYSFFSSFVFACIAVGITTFMKGASDEDIKRREEAARQRRENLIYTYASIIAAVVKADNKFQEEEEKLAKAFAVKLLKTKEEYKSYMTFYQNCLREDNIALQFDTLKAYTTYKERFVLVDLLFCIICADNTITVKEWNIVQDCIIKLSISGNDIEFFNKTYRFWFENRERENRSNSENKSNTARQTQNKQSVAYGVLGLTTQASQEEIHNAYIKLAKKFHPDTVQDEKLKEVMAERFKEIQKAYDELRTKS